MPFDPQSAHYKTKQSAIVAFDQGVGAAAQYTIAGVIECFKSPDLHKETEKAIPVALMKLGSFVKGTQLDQNWSGRANPNVEGHKILKFLPFSERCFMIYVADVVMAFRLSSIVESEMTSEEEFRYPFSSAQCFLDHVDAVTDVNRCAVREVLESTDQLRSLSCRSCLTPSRLSMSVCESVM